MELDPKIAEKIVDNLKDVINHDINLFDTTGKIIASTNRDRIGSIHQGAYIAAHTKEFLEIENDQVYEGSRKGINVPIMFNDTVAAVIGITGEKEEVAPYGNIIKKMTEILILENIIQLNSFNRNLNYNDLVNNLLVQQGDQELINYLSNVLDIDLTIPRRVAIGKVAKGSAMSYDMNRLTPLIHGRLESQRGTFFAINNHELYIFCGRPVEADTIELLRSIQRAAKEDLQMDLVFGLGSLKASYGDYWESAEESRIALNWLNHIGEQGMFESNETIINFKSLDEALVFSDISAKNAEFLLKKVFNEIPQEDINKYREVFRAYVSENGSIIRGAGQLYIHKNTFQNKLNQIYDLTGYNPRELKDFVVLYIAFALRDYQSSLGASTSDGSN